MLKIWQVILLALVVVGWQQPANAGAISTVGRRR